MHFRELLEIINNDIERWDNINIVKAYILIPEFRLIWRYRWLQFYRTHKCLRVISAFERILYHKSCVRCGCDIPSHVAIGSGFKMLHGFGIVINSKTVIGGICIGNNVEIGAGSVVTHSVPDNVVIYGEVSHIRKIKEV